MGNMVWVPQYPGSFWQEEKRSQDCLGKGVQLLLKLSSFQGLEKWLSHFDVQKHYLGNLLKMSEVHLERVWGGASLGICM